MVGLKNSIRNQSFKKSTIKSGKSGYGFEGENVFFHKTFKNTNHKQDWYI